MIIFLLIFLGLYGSINFYFFFKAKNFLHFSGKAEFIIIILMIFLILAPMIIRLAEKLDLETVARLIAYFGYLWMAFIFLFFFVNISLDLTRFALHFFFKAFENSQMKTVFFVLAILLSLSFVLYGYIDAQKIRIKQMEITSEKLSPNLQKIRIIQISDLHIGLIIRDKRLKSILEKVNNLKPDIVVSTGDLLDGELDDVHIEAEQFAEIKPKYGKYAVTGNHEYYAGIEKALAFTEKAGFEILRNGSKKIAGINIIGLEDETGRKLGLSSTNSSNSIPEEKSNEFILLLKHQPTIEREQNFDLQLSGHTHGGQIFPFAFFVRIFFPINSGYNVRNNKSIYVSNGAGTWGPPVRFLAPPEITVIDLIKK